MPHPFTYTVLLLVLYGLAPPQELWAQEEATGQEEHHKNHVAFFLGGI